MSYSAWALCLIWTPGEPTNFEIYSLELWNLYFSRARRSIITFEKISGIICYTLTDQAYRYGKQEEQVFSEPKIRLNNQKNDSGVTWLNADVIKHTFYNLGEQVIVRTKVLYHIIESPETQKYFILKIQYQDAFNEQFRYK